MKNITSTRLLMVLAMLIGALPAVMATDRLFIDAVNFEPGETKALVLVLDNSQDFFGFQFDMKLPDGMSFVRNGDKADCTLSSRVGSDYAVVSNILSDNHARLGAFSTSHIPISGTSGTLIYVNVKASDDFAGGILELSDILFTDASNRDVALPGFFLESGTRHDDRFYIPDFRIAAGETKEISLILDNETAFTAFQTDIYLPEGLSIVEGSPAMSGRGCGHTVSARAFSDGRVRLACLSLGNDVFTGNSGPLVSLRVNASNDIAGTCVIEMKNQRFSMPDAKEYTLSNSSTTVTVERALVTSIVLGHSTLTMVTGDNVVVSAEVLPEFASMKDLEWSSSDPVVADVDAAGSVTAGEPGTATITAAAMDGSGITATCEVTVYGIPVSGITLNRTSARLKVSESLQLTATVLPANAFVRDVIWSGSDDAVATVSETGIVTAVKEGSVTVTATSVSDPLISAACVITVIPTPVTEIRLSPASMRLKAGEQSELSVTVMPETATDKSISFSSSDPSVATVDEVGNILAVSVGSVYITVSALDGSDVSAVCAVTVDPTPVESVSISADGPTTIRVAQTVQLSASVLPSTATDKTVRWLSSDPSVATVDANGLVSAVSVGQTTINAIAGNRIDRILITVDPTLAESLTLNRNSVVMKVGGTMQIIATVGPVTATDKTVRYESTGKSVATVDDLGNVTAIGLGECEIIVSTLDGSGLAATCHAQVEETAAESVKISPSGPFTLNIGETVALSAEVLPETATDKSVTWRSQTEAVSVDADGLVTALAPVENNRIVATNSNGQADYVYVTVLPTPVKSIVVDKTVVVLRVGGSETVSATVLPEDATDKGISWSSYNTAVASVDNAGKITAVSIGETDIRAVAADGSGVTATVHVSVIATPVESVAISADGGTILKDGETLQLVATVLPADATDRTVTWKSDAPSRASVDANGLVSAHAETGRVMISATAGDMTSSITLTIAETPVESISIISLGGSSAEIIHGGTLQLSAEILPVTATDRSVRWHVSDASVISVDGNGLVTALSPGEAYVYAETAGGIKASQHVVVKPVLVERIVIPEKVTLGTGEEYRFRPEIYPDNASIRTLRWTVTESAVGTMSGDDGVFHAVTKGSTKVVCSATDGSGVSQTCEIEVIKRVTSVRLSEHDLKLSLPGEMQLQADVEPIDASDRRVEWQSSRPDVAEVSQAGLITAISEGEAVISATSMSDSECRDECVITVVKEESGISAITVDDIRIRVGEGIITVENLPAGYKVSVCDLSGRILQSDCGGRENVTFYVPTGTVYVVSVGGHAIKVVV